MLPHLLDLAVPDQVGRQHARRVAGVYPGILDVLHHTADDASRPIGDRVHVGLERILQTPLDPDRVFRSDPSSYTSSIARPPSTYDGRTSTGYPMRWATATASSTDRAMPLGGWRMP